MSQQDATTSTRSAPNLRSDFARPHVYFIQGANGGPIKIGVAANVSVRIDALQVGNPYPLVVRGVIPHAGRAVEVELHARFRRHHIIGEWFEPVPDLVALCHASHADVPARWQREVDDRIAVLTSALEELTAAVDRHRRGRRGARANYDLYRTADRVGRRR